MASVRPRMVRQAGDFCKAIERHFALNSGLIQVLFPSPVRFPGTFSFQTTCLCTRDYRGMS
jgi:hypothetical protein